MNVVCATNITYAPCSTGCVQDHEENCQKDRCVQDREENCQKNTHLRSRMQGCSQDHGSRRVRFVSLYGVLLNPC